MKRNPFDQPKPESLERIIMQDDNPFLNEKRKIENQKNKEANYKRMHDQTPINIENTIFQESLPVNSIPVIDRLKELLEESGTNNIKEAGIKDIRIRKCMWLLMAQYISSIGFYDIQKSWEALMEQENFPNPKARIEQEYKRISKKL